MSDTQNETDLNAARLRERDVLERMLVDNRTDVENAVLRAVSGTTMPSHTVMVWVLPSSPVYAKACANMPADVAKLDGGQAGLLAALRRQVFVSSLRIDGFANTATWLARYARRGYLPLVVYGATQVHTLEIVYRQPVIKTVQGLKGKGYVRMPGS